MLDAIRRYQQHRIFQLILQNISLHLYLALVLTLILLLIDSFETAFTAFFICVFLSVFYNVILYERRKGNYREAALNLDRELNGQDIFVTILEYPSSSENLMLQLLHDRGQRMSNGILSQDFDNQDRKLLSQTVRRFFIILVILLILFLLLNFLDSDSFDKSSKFDPKTSVHKIGVSESVNKKKTEPVSMQSHKKDFNKLGSDSVSTSSKMLKKNANASRKKTTIASGKNSSKRSKLVRKESSNSGIGDSKSKGKMNAQQKIRGVERSSEKNSKKNKDFESSKGGRANKSSLKNIGKSELNKSKNDLSLRDKQLKNNFFKKAQQNPHKPSLDTKFDSGVFGDLGGQKSFEKLNFNAQRDIKNTQYKRQQDELEQVLNNPRIPKSYKNILKRFYSSEKK